jgi:hypothetical protein
MKRKAKLQTSKEFSAAAILDSRRAQEKPGEKTQSIHWA